MKSTIVSMNYESEILDKEMSISVYLPEDYEVVKPSSVLYFLHGRTGSDKIMFQLGLKERADRLIKAGAMKPLIIVCPNLENSRGVNSSWKCKEIASPTNENRTLNLGMYEDYFIKEIIPLIEKTFHTESDRKGRFIGGVSAGGYIALHSALRYQDLFSKVGGHMPALELEIDEEAKLYYKDMEIWEEYDPLYIAKNSAELPEMAVYLDAGDADEGKFYEGCEALHELLLLKGLNVENHVFPGNHSPEYVISNVDKYLKFYGSME